MTNARSRILWTLFAVVSIVSGTLIAIRFAQGYRPSRDRLVAGNGLLVVNSTPKGARVFINDRFTTATDDTLYLDPGEYTVSIQKDGYFTWNKTVQVEQELVTQANALLFPTAPSLSPLTFSGAEHLAPSPDGQRIAFYSASSSAQTKNGYYVHELSDNPLAFQRGSRQIAQVSELFPAEETQMLWSPNSSQLILISPYKAVLLDPSRLNDLNELTDISFQLNTILSQWEEEMYLRDRERLAVFPAEIQQIATQSAVNVYFSPDEEKVLYTATESFTLAENILPSKPASNTQPQERTTEIGGIYIYDRKEDRQFRIGTDEQYLTALATKNADADQTSNAVETTTTQHSTTVDQLDLRTLNGDDAVAGDTDSVQEPQFNPQKVLLANDLYQRPVSLESSPSAFQRLQDADGDIDRTIISFKTYHSPLFSHGFQWFPNSYHIITHDATGITITEYDNTNAVRIYSGPFENSFVYPWPNGSRLIIQTNFNQGTSVPINLYTIDLK
ncbi:PEGA domain-containing protein [Candidatus Woesebacteria bacterium]|nr:PEGA domain-containing protein [Candidatus Woesebacteria bacterium]MCD8527098.1 PEGA domain-containing protein [Candidatus Woesebacteria bacterium]MCD8546727.1 PEGA domain-containing protein [Candidatus Woesebacteria bacterium]